VAIGVFLDEQSFANMLLGVTMLESLISVIVVFFLSDRNQAQSENRETHLRFSLSNFNKRMSNGANRRG
jgi:hypothetical protein